MAFNIRKEFVVKHTTALLCGCLFLTLLSVTIVICSWTHTKHIDAHSRRNLFAEANLESTALSSILQGVISQTYTEINKHNEIFVTEYLNNHISVKEFFLDKLTYRKPSAKLVGSKSCVRNVDQKQSMAKVLFGANNEGLYPSHGFLTNGVLFQNGRLIVPLTGTYLIYSSIHHRLQCSLSREQASAEEEHLVRHAMYRFNIRLGHDQEVASTHQDHIDCNCSAFVDFQTEISTLVELWAGDEISVKLNDCSLHMHSESNYFGLRLI